MFEWLQAVELGVTNLLCSILELDGSIPEGEEASTHVLLILGLLTDSGQLYLVLVNLCCIYCVKYSYKRKTWKGEMIKKHVKKKGRVQHLLDTCL